MKRYLLMFIILVLFLVGFNIRVEANIRRDTSFHFNFSVSQQRMRYNFYGHYNNWLGGFNLEQRENIDRIGILAGRRFKLNNNLILNLMVLLGRNFSQKRYYFEG